MNEDHLKKNFHDARSKHGLFENVTQNVINISAKKSYAECIDIILDYKNALKDNFYGAVLRTTSNRITINPFHILTALSALNNDKYMNNVYNIIIYVYDDRQKLNVFTKNEVSDHKLINSNIDALMNAYISRVPTVTRIIADENSNNDKAKTYKRVIKQTRKFPDEDPTYNHYISCNQLITRGIFAPFYGASLIRMNGNTTGLRLTPFGSCNIGSDSNSDLTSAPSYKSVCTGSRNNKTLHGLRSLSHANLSSPFGGGFIQNGALAYADIMIERCISLYEDAQVIEKGKNVPLDFDIPVVPAYEDGNLFSDAEIECISLFEYARHCRNMDELPSDIAAIGKRYREIQNWRKTT